MIKGFIFDLDNTLIDDEKGWGIALRQTCEFIKNRFNLNYSENDIFIAYKHVSDYIWNNYSKFLSNFHTRDEKRNYVWKKTLENLKCYENEIQLNEIVNFFATKRIDNVIPYSGAQELLMKINEMGIKVIICTDGEEKLQKLKCEKANIGNLVSKIISATDLGYRKPDKRVFKKCIEFFGVESNTLMYIGDDKIKDIEGVYNVGMQAILVNGDNGIKLEDIYYNINTIVREGKIIDRKGKA